jgi:hypothetical protein
MAQSITRLLPNRSIDEKDVINFYSLNAASGEAGTFVKVVDADLSKDSVQYVNRPDAFLNNLGNATSQYPEVPYKVGETTGTGDAGAVLGMLLKDVRETDENGQKLHFYNQKRDELQCLLSGEAVPILTAGVVEINARGLEGGVAPNINDAAVLGANGKVTGVAYASLSAEQKDAVVGKFIGTGIRVSQQSTDAFAGAYAKLKFSI